MSKGVVLDGLRKKSVVLLPVSGGEIEMWDYPLVGDVTPTSLSPGVAPEVKPLEVIVKMIASWNFISAEGETLPINDENLKKIPAPDFVVIAERVEKASRASALSTDEKKATPVSSI